MGEHDDARFAPSALCSQQLQSVPRFSHLYCVHWQLPVDGHPVFAQQPPTPPTDAALHAPPGGAPLLSTRQRQKSLVEPLPQTMLPPEPDPVGVGDVEDEGAGWFEDDP